MQVIAWLPACPQRYSKPSDGKSHQSALGSSVGALHSPQENQGCAVGVWLLMMAVYDWLCCRRNSHAAGNVANWRVAEVGEPLHAETHRSDPPNEERLRDRPHVGGIQSLLLYYCGIIPVRTIIASTHKWNAEGLLRPCAPPGSHHVSHAVSRGLKKLTLLPSLALRWPCVRLDHGG